MTPDDASGTSGGALGAVLDLGTARTTCWIADRAGGGVRVIALGEAASEGVRAGEVVDVRAAAGSVHAAVREAEAQSGLAVEGVCAALAGAAVSSFPGRGAVPITNEDREIAPADVRRAVERAGAVGLPAGTFRLHVVPRSFAVDGAGPVRNPVGLSGAILEAEALGIAAPVFAAENLTRAVRLAGRHLASAAAAPAALGLGTLTEEERELGALAIDIGAGLTGYAAWKGGELCACGCVPVGGELITRDIAVGLGLSREAAEGLKRGGALARTVSGEDAPDSTLSAPSVGGGGPRRFTQRELSEIVEARIEEALLLVQRRLERLDPARYFGAGVVLAGGSARIAAAEEKAREVFRVPARVAKPSVDATIPRELSAPENALGIGLVRWALEGARARESASRRGGIRMIADAVRWLAAGF